VHPCGYPSASLLPPWRCQRQLPQLCRAQHRGPSQDYDRRSWPSPGAVVPLVLGSLGLEEQRNGQWR